MQTNWEVEQKYYVDDMTALKLSLNRAGFESMGTERNSDTYFRHPNRDFRATDEAFRIRTLDKSSCVTYKGKRLAGAVKTRPEIELPIVHEDRESWLEMLKQLGFEPLPAVRKIRHIYKRTTELTSGASKMVVTLDEVQLLGNFAEIEIVVAEASELERASAQIQAMARELGLSRVQSKSYLSQLLAKIGWE